MKEVAPGSFAYPLLGALHSVETQFESALEPLGLSLAKFGVLSKLAASGEPLPLRTLAERCACVRSNITQLVDRLEVEKLVRRSDDPNDRRSVLAELTAEGRKRQVAGVRALEDAERALVARLPHEQRDSFLQLLQCLKGEA